MPFHSLTGQIMLIAYAIVVAGNDVYVAGEEYNGTNYVAKYWKNGISMALTDGSKEAHAYSIAVSGTDIYVAGSEMSGMNGNMVADYWKNGTVFHLTDGSNYARANSITVSGTSVYAAGAEFKDGNFFVAKYWLNGYAVAITDSSNYSMANSIVVQDHNIYIAGKELQGAFMQGKPVALYWKNGSEVPVQDPSDSGGWTNSVFINSGNGQGQEKNGYGEDNNSDGGGIHKYNNLWGRNSCNTQEIAVFRRIIFFYSKTFKKQTRS